MWRWMKGSASAIVGFAVAAHAGGAGVPITHEGRPVLAGGGAALEIHAADTNGQPAHVLAAIDDLARCLRLMTGADVEVARGPVPPADAAGIFVGTAAQLAAAGFDVPRDLSPQELALRTPNARQVVLAGGGDWGVAHAVYEFLDRLGCRWYYPGEAWEVIPKRPDLAVSLDVRAGPDFFLQRRIWIGHGIHSPTLQKDFADWSRRNRVGQPIDIATSHSWPGIDPEKDFAAHPEWFALTKGERKPGKPCYTEPAVIAAGIRRAVEHFAANPDSDMISVSAPDGLGFCECDRCRAFAQVVRTNEAHGTLFGTTADGREVSIASETLFSYANQVAKAVAAKHPGKYVGCLAYSAYAHPPSFGLESNIYVEVTRGYRRTPLTQSEQIAQFAAKASLLGIYEYYDVEQWSWDRPGAARASDLAYLAGSIPYYYRNNMRSLSGEMSLNFAPNGIGYYVIARLLWDHAADARAIEEEFYRTAFGPAAGPLKRFYRRWESGQALDPRTLALAYRDLAEAASLTEGQAEYRRRVDLIRMYARFLKLFLQPQDGSGGKDIELWKQTYGEEEAVRRVRDLGEWVSRTIDTSMTHGWAFNRYFSRRGTALGIDTAAWGKPGTVPSGDEIERLFREDLKAMDTGSAQEVPATLFSRKLVPLALAAPALAATNGVPILLETDRPKQLTALVAAGESLEVALAAAPPAGASRARFVPREDYENGLGDLTFQWVAGTGVGSNLAFRAPADGYLSVEVASPVSSVSAPAFLAGDMNIRRARLFFFVPGGTPRFIVRSGAHGGPTIRVLTGKGKVVLDVAKSARNEFLIEVPPGEDGAVWTFEGPDDVNGVSSVRLIGIPNRMSLSPAQILVPAECLPAAPRPQAQD